MNGHKVYFTIKHSTYIPVDREALSLLCQALSSIGDINWKEVKL